MHWELILVKHISNMIILSFFLIDLFGEIEISCPSDNINLVFDDKKGVCEI